MIRAILRAILVRFGQARHSHRPKIPASECMRRNRESLAGRKCIGYLTSFAGRAQHPPRCVSRRKLSGGVAASPFTASAAVQDERRLHEDSAQRGYRSDRHRPYGCATGKRGGPRAPIKAGLLLAHQKVYLIQGDAPIRYIPDFFSLASRLANAYAGYGCDLVALTRPGD